MRSSPRVCAFHATGFYVYAIEFVTLSVVGLAEVAHSVVSGGSAQGTTVLAPGLQPDTFEPGHTKPSVPNSGALKTGIYMYIMFYAASPACCTVCFSMQCTFKIAITITIKRANPSVCIPSGILYWLPFLLNPKTSNSFSRALFVCGLHILYYHADQFYINGLPCKCYYNSDSGIAAIKSGRFNWQCSYRNVTYIHIGVQHTFAHQNCTASHSF